MNRFTHVALIACSLFVCAAHPAAIFARTWTVDDDLAQFPQADFTDVQPAIDAAAHGDTVLVYPGTYIQNLRIIGKNIHLTSTGSGDKVKTEQTILSGNRRGSVITLGGFESPDCIIEGFTIQNGAGPIGGGIYGGEARSEATIINNIIRHNTSDEGGGIANSIGLIAGNSIIENGALLGGGLFQCGGNMFNNEISNNIASEGGGFNRCSGRIKKNVISGNNAISQGGAFARCLGFIEGNVISENSAQEGGGFIFSGIRIADNFIYSNTAARGGAFFTCQGTIENNVIAKNGAADAGGAFYGGGGRIVNNHIVGNYAEDRGGAFASLVNVVVESNEVHFNVALGQGGGFESCTGTITRNDILGNTSDRGGAFANCNARIDANTISRNDAWLGGAAAGCFGIFQNNLVQSNIASRGQALDRCGGLIQNNTFAFNVSDVLVEGSDGGALFIDVGGTRLRNNIFYRNEDVEVLLARLDPAAEDKIFFENNNFYNPGHPLVELSDRTRSFNSIKSFENKYPFAKGNIQADPLFVAEAGPDGDPIQTEDNDFSLKAGSPCINAGRIEVMAAMPVRDRLGNARLHFGLADIGCYEFGSTPDTDGDGLSDLLESVNGTEVSQIDTDDDGLTDAMELILKTNPRVADAPRTGTLLPGESLQERVLLSFRGDTINIMPGSYYGSTTFMGKALRLRGSNPTNPATVAATILDASRSGSVITLTGSEGVGSLIEGLTLQFGGAPSGSAVFGADSSIDIRHCVIRRNTSEVSGAVAMVGGEIAFCRFEFNIAATGGAVSDARSAIHDCVFEQNSSGVTGGALFQCFGPITNNVFNANRSRQGGAAGSIFGLLTGNTFTSNTATFGAGVFNASKTISGNKFLYNVGRDGGALLLCRALIENNEFIANRADTGAGMRGCQGDVVGNKFIGNTARVNGGAIWGSIGSFENNLFEANTSFAGGAIMISSGPMNRNVFRNNSAETEGGAIALCTSDLTENRFENNFARDGGAVSENEGDIANNSFTGNSSSRDGGALHTGIGLIERNSFIGNRAANGGAIINFTGTLLHNFMQGNSAEHAGGAMAAFNGNVFGNLFQANTAPDGAAARGGRSDFRNNTLTDNTASSGAVLQDVTTGTIENNIFAANTGIGFFVPAGGPRPVKVRANVFWNNSRGHYTHLGNTTFKKVADLDAKVAEASANFEFDPVFVASAGPDGNPLTFADNNLRLAAGSPAIDRGVALVDGPAVDLAGGPRLASGGPTSIPAIDIGAYEFLTLTIFDPAADIKVHGGDILLVRWLSDPATAGTAIRFEMYDKTLKVADLGTFNSPTGEGTAKLKIPSYLWKDHPYRLRAYSVLNRQLWSQAPGQITLKSGSGNSDGKDDGTGPPQSAADAWFHYR